MSTAKNSEMKVGNEELGGRYTVSRLKVWEEKENLTQRDSNEELTGRGMTDALRNERKMTATPLPYRDPVDGE